MIEPSPSTKTDRVQISMKQTKPNTQTINKCMCVLCSILVFISVSLTVFCLTYFVNNIDSKQNVSAPAIVSGIMCFLCLLAGIPCVVFVLCMWMNQENFAAYNAPLYKCITRYWPFGRVSQVVTFQSGTTNRRECNTDSASTLPIEDVPGIIADQDLRNIAVVNVEVEEPNRDNAEINLENFPNLKIPSVSTEETSRSLSFLYTFAQHSEACLAPVPAVVLDIFSKSAPGSLREINPYIVEYPREELSPRTDLTSRHGVNTIVDPVKATATVVSGRISDMSSSMTQKEPSKD